MINKRLIPSSYLNIFFTVLSFLFIVSFFLINISNVSAQEFPNFQDKYVNDFANLFSDNETIQLRTLLSEVEQNTTAEVVVVTINTTSPLAPSQYRTELFNYWKIGKADKDNGLLILYSVTENRIEVETGYGLEGILPDSKLGRMLDDYYVPYRDNGNVTAGIILFTQEVSKIIRENSEEIYSGQKTTSQSFEWLNYLIFILIWIIITAVFKKIAKMRMTRKCEKDGLIMKYIGLAGGYLIFKCAKGHTHKELKTRSNAGFFIGSGSGFGGGFGGGGFGGGMSGGGGAGR